VDGKIVGTTGSGSAIEWPLVPGAHEITVRDHEGRTAATTVVVR
jgi:hypothetical protein